MIEQDLTPRLKALLGFIRQHAAAEISDRGTFDPYGILLKRNEMMFLETYDDSDEVLKGKPAAQMRRRIEDKIREQRDDLNVESAALVVDSSYRLLEGGGEGDAVRAWLDDRGKQRVLAMIYYELNDGVFTEKETVFQLKNQLFLPS
jgi:hypothetical protein